MTNSETRNKLTVAIFLCFWEIVWESVSACSLLTFRLSSSLVLLFYHLGDSCFPLPCASLTSSIFMDFESYHGEDNWKKLPMWARSVNKPGGLPFWLAARLFKCFWRCQSSLMVWALPGPCACHTLSTSGEIDHQQLHRSRTRWTLLFAAMLNAFVGSDVADRCLSFRQSRVLQNTQRISIAREKI